MTHSTTGPSGGPTDGVSEVDAFDLPDWLGQDGLTWHAEGSLRGRHRVAGSLAGAGGAFACDLLAGDQAYPAAALPEPWRSRAHREWTHGQVLLLTVAGRLTLVVPGTELSADTVLEVIGRLARALGVPPERFVVALRP